MLNNKCFIKYKSLKYINKLRIKSWTLGFFITVIVPIYVLLSSNIIGSFKLFDAPTPDYSKNGHYYIIQNRSAYSAGNIEEMTKKQVSDWKANKYHRVTLKLPVIRNTAIFVILLTGAKSIIDIKILKESLKEK